MTTKQPRQNLNLPTDEQIADGFDLLRLGHVKREPFTTSYDFARSFKKCSVLKDDCITFSQHAGV